METIDTSAPQILVLLLDFTARYEHCEIDEDTKIKDNNIDN
jgi:hypothetical protein